MNDLCIEADDICMYIPGVSNQFASWRLRPNGLPISLAERRKPVTPWTHTRARMDVHGGYISTNTKSRFVHGIGRNEASYSAAE